MKCCGANIVVIMKCECREQGSNFWSWLEVTALFPALTVSSSIIIPSCIYWWYIQQHSSCLMLELNRFRSFITQRGRTNHRENHSQGLLMERSNSNWAQMHILSSSTSPVHAYIYSSCCMCKTVINSCSVVEHCIGRSSQEPWVHSQQLHLMQG